MKYFNKILKFKPTIRLIMESKIKGKASPEDVGIAIKRSYTTVSIGIMVMLSCFGIASIIFALSAL